MISEYTDAYFGMMHDIGIGYQIVREQRVRERERLLRQKDGGASLIEWEKREQQFAFPFSRGQTTAYNAWKESKDNGLEIVECRDLPWEKDFQDFIETLREARIEAIIVTDSAFRSKKYAHFFEEAGCIIVGTQKFIRHEKRSTGIENVDATGILVAIDGEKCKGDESRLPTPENTVTLDVEEAKRRLQDPQVQEEIRAILTGEDGEQA